MKKLTILFASLFIFVGCGKKTDDIQHIDVSSSNIGSNTIVTSSLGEACGGEAATKCGDGLECKNNDPAPGSAGICVETVVDKTLECEDIKSPVCGQKGDNKNGYLNACEAQRHGAEVLHKGFCKVDPETEGSCTAKAIGIGNCEAFFEGYEFDGSNCVKKGFSGCEAEFPFKTLQACETACQ